MVVFTTFQNCQLDIPLNQLNAQNMVLRIGLAIRAQDDIRPLVFHIDGSSDGRVPSSVPSTAATLPYSEPASPAPTLQYSVPVSPAPTLQYSVSPARTLQYYVPESPEWSPSMQPSSEAERMPAASDDVWGDTPSTLVGLYH